MIGEREMTKRTGREALEVEVSTMRKTVLFQMPSREECSAAESVLKSMGYGVSPALGSRSNVQVQVAPGEKPQAALQAAGIDFRLQLAET